MPHRKLSHDIEASVNEDALGNSSQQPTSAPLRRRSQNGPQGWPEQLSQALRNDAQPGINDDGSSHVAVDVTTLQRLSLYNIQHELLQRATEMKWAETGQEHANMAFSSEAMTQLHMVLHKYCASICYHHRLMPILAH